MSGTSQTLSPALIAKFQRIADNTTLSGDQIVKAVTTEEPKSTETAYYLWLIKYDSGNIVKELDVRSMAFVDAAAAINDTDFKDPDAMKKLYDATITAVSPEAMPIGSLVSTSGTVFYCISLAQGGLPLDFRADTTRDDCCITCAKWTPANKALPTFLYELGPVFFADAASKMRSDSTDVAEDKSIDSSFVAVVDIKTKIVWALFNPASTETLSESDIRETCGPFPGLQDPCTAVLLGPVERILPLTPESANKQLTIPKENIFILPNASGNTSAFGGITADYWLDLKTVSTKFATVEDAKLTPSTDKQTKAVTGTVAAKSAP